MSATVRWILAVIIFLIGASAASVAVFGGAFSTVACMDVPPDWVYYILLLVAAAMLAAATASSVFVVRGARPIKVAMSGAIGILFMCVGTAAYFTILGQYC